MAHVLDLYQSPSQQLCPPAASEIVPVSDTRAIISMQQLSRDLDHCIMLLFLKAARLDRAGDTMLCADQFAICLSVTKDMHAWDVGETPIRAGSVS